MIGRFNNIKIQGIQTAAPREVLDSRTLTEEFDEKKLKRLLSMTGVYNRHLMEPGRSITELVIEAADTLIEKVKWDRGDIRVLVYLTQSPEFSTPSTAMYIQKQLRIGIGCIAFDSNLGCSAYTAGLQIVSSLLQNCEDGSKGLLLVGDAANLRKKEPGDAMLFGEAVAATALERIEHSTPMFFMQNTDGTRYEAIFESKNHEEKLRMDGEGVFRFATGDVTESIIRCRKYFNIEESLLDYYVLHQAQKFIVENMADLCDIPAEKLLLSMEEYGNTSGASIPVTLAHNIKKLKDKDKIMAYLCGFGVGLSWGSVICEIGTDKIFPILLCD